MWTKTHSDLKPFFNFGQHEIAMNELYNISLNLNIYMK